MILLALLSLSVTSLTGVISVLQVKLLKAWGWVLGYSLAFVSAAAASVAVSKPFEHRHLKKKIINQQHIDQLSKSFGEKNNNAKKPATAYPAQHQEQGRKLQQYYEQRTKI